MKFPSALTILMILAALVAISTWVIPAGNYDSLTYNADTDTFTRTGNPHPQAFPATQEVLDELNIKIPLGNFTSGAIYRPVGIPETYQKVDARPQGFIAFVMSPIKGILEVADIIFLVMIIGGMIGVMNLTGAFNAAIAWMGNALKGREYLLIIFTTTLTAVAASTYGFGEESIALYLILIPLFMAAGYDAMVGLASVFCGLIVGSLCSTINPFATIIASDAAGILWTTGLSGRIIMFVLCVSITILFILLYANKVKKNPEKSLLFHKKEELETIFGMHDKQEVPPLNLQRILILIVFAGSFGMMIFGVIVLDWWFLEMTTVFLVGAIAIGFIARINETKFVESFSKGAGDLLGVAFIIGVARGISILMNDGMISDTVLFHAASATEGMSSGFFINSIYLIYGGLYFLIPSSSGMAVLTMPIFAPLADTAGLGREMIVNAYQFGGLAALIYPTGLLLPSLAICKIGYDEYLKFIWPLLLILGAVTMIVLTIMVSI